MSLPKDFEAFINTMDLPNPPEHWPKGLKSIWYDVNGDWHNAHEIAQEMYDTTGSWLHAYLHRKEGDMYNARYWYNKANRIFPKNSLLEEQREIVEFFL